MRRPWKLLFALLLLHLVSDSAQSPGSPPPHAPLDPHGACRTGAASALSSQLPECVHPPTENVVLKSPTKPNRHLFTRDFHVPPPSVWNRLRAWWESRGGDWLYDRPDPWRWWEFWERKGWRRIFGSRTNIRNVRAPFPLWQDIYLPQFTEPMQHLPKVFENRKWSFPGISEETLRVVPWTHLPEDIKQFVIARELQFAGFELMKGLISHRHYPLDYQEWREYYHQRALFLKEEQARLFARSVVKEAATLAARRAEELGGPIRDFSSSNFFWRRRMGWTLAIQVENEGSALEAKLRPIFQEQHQQGRPPSLIPGLDSTVRSSPHPEVDKKALELGLETPPYLDYPSKPGIEKPLQYRRPRKYSPPVGLPEDRPTKTPPELRLGMTGKSPTDSIFRPKTPPESIHGPGTPPELRLSVVSKSPSKSLFGPRTPPESIHAPRTPPELRLEPHEHVVSTGLSRNFEQDVRPTPLDGSTEAKSPQEAFVRRRRLPSWRRIERMPVHIEVPAYMESGQSFLPADSELARERSVPQLDGPAESKPLSQTLENVGIGKEPPPIAPDSVLTRKPPPHSLYPSNSKSMDHVAALLDHSTDPLSFMPNAKKVTKGWPSEYYHSQPDLLNRKGRPLHYHPVHFSGMKEEDKAWFREGAEELHPRVKVVGPEKPEVKWVYRTGPRWRPYMYRELREQQMASIRQVSKDFSKVIPQADVPKKPSRWQLWKFWKWGVWKSIFRRFKATQKPSAQQPRPSSPWDRPPRPGEEYRVRQKPPYEGWVAEEHLGNMFDSSSLGDTGRAPMEESWPGFPRSMWSDSHGSRTPSSSVLGFEPPNWPYWSEWQGLPETVWSPPGSDSQVDGPKEARPRKASEGPTRPWRFWKFWEWRVWRKIAHFFRTFRPWRPKPPPGGYRQGSRGWNKYPQQRYGVRPRKPLPLNARLKAWAKKWVYRVGMWESTILPERTPKNHYSQPRPARAPKVRPAPVSMSGWAASRAQMPQVDGHGWTPGDPAASLGHQLDGTSGSNPWKNPLSHEAPISLSSQKNSGYQSSTSLDAPKALFKASVNKIGPNPGEQPEWLRRLWSPQGGFQRHASSPGPIRSLAERPEWLKRLWSPRPKGSRQLAPGWEGRLWSQRGRPWPMYASDGKTTPRHYSSDDSFALGHFSPDDPFLPRHHSSDDLHGPRHFSSDDLFRPRHYSSDDLGPRHYSQDDRSSRYYSSESPTPRGRSRTEKWITAAPASEWIPPDDAHLAVGKTSDRSPRYYSSDSPTPRGRSRTEKWITAAPPDDAHLAVGKASEDLSFKVDKGKGKAPVGHIDPPAPLPKVKAKQPVPPPIDPLPPPVEAPRKWKNPNANSIKTPPIPQAPKKLLDFSKPKKWLAKLPKIDLGLKQATAISSEKISRTIGAKLTAKITSGLEKSLGKAAARFGTQIIAKATVGIAAARMFTSVIFRVLDVLNPVFIVADIIQTPFMIADWVTNAVPHEFGKCDISQNVCIQKTLKSSRCSGHHPCEVDGATCGYRTISPHKTVCNWDKFAFWTKMTGMTSMQQMWREHSATVNQRRARRDMEYLEQLKRDLAVCKKESECSLLERAIKYRKKKLEKHTAWSDMYTKPSWAKKAKKLWHKAEVFADHHVRYWQKKTEKWEKKVKEKEARRHGKKANWRLRRARRQLKYRQKNLRISMSKLKKKIAKAEKYSMKADPLGMVNNWVDTTKMTEKEKMEFIQTLTADTQKAKGQKANVRKRSLEDNTAGNDHWSAFHQSVHTHVGSLSRQLLEYSTVGNDSVLRPMDVGRVLSAVKENPRYFAERPSKVLMSDTDWIGTFSIALAIDWTVVLLVVGLFCRRRICAWVRRHGWQGVRVRTGNDAA